MSTSRIEAIVRNFPENGLKLLLENPRNVRDLLILSGADWVDEIDLDHLTRLPTTFVERDYRHVESDVVLTAPLREVRGKVGRKRKTVTIYVLIEHQSEPDRLMPLRVLEYVVQIFKAQLREWSRRHSSFARIRLQPVLPVVFYTGTRRWDTIGTVRGLVERGERFGPLTPEFEPLFVNLSRLPTAALESADGYFGWVLRLIRERHARTEEFQELLRRVVGHLETMPDVERLRWLEILSYIQALVYHERDVPERPGMQETIEASVQTDEHRQELNMARKTIWEAIKDEGREEGEILSLRKTLLSQLRRRFGQVPVATKAVIETTGTVRELDKWLEKVVSVESLEDMRITPR